jgi:Tfp pilus assembly protein PilX
MTHATLAPLAGRSARPLRSRGTASILAMLFLVLFAVLAVGFMEATVMSAQVSDNDRVSQQERIAAESGMAFIRYQMSAITLPPGTTSANLLSNVAARLGNAMNGTTNMGTAPVVVTPATGTAPATIYLPTRTGWITADPASGSRFRITITQSTVSPNNLIVTSRGMNPDGSAGGGVQFQFQPAPKPYALIGLSSVTLSGSANSNSYDASKGGPARIGRYDSANTNDVGSIASNGNVTLSNTATVDGDLRYGVTGYSSIAPTAVVTGIVAPLSRSVSYASVTLPPAGTYTDLVDVTMSSGTTTAAGGTYVINNLNLSGTAKIIWTGPVKLYIKSGYSVTGGADIQTYDQLPVNRQLFFLPTCTTATWNGTNKCVGELYAPDTTFNISGSVEMFGRITAKVINNSSSGGMHYDESLPAPNGQSSYAPIPGSYLEVP